MKFEAEHEIELSDYSIQRLVSVLRRGAWLLLLAFLLGAGSAYIVSKLQTPIYSASTQVIVARPSTTQSVVTDITQGSTSQQIAETYVELLSQRWVLDEVSKMLGGDRVSAGQVATSAVENTQIIDIKVEDADPKRAALIADALVRVLIEQNDTIQSGRYDDAEKNLDVQIAQMAQQIADTQAELKQANADALVEQIAKVKNNIQITQAEIAVLQSDSARLKEIPPEGAAALLTVYQNQQAQLQANLERQLVEYDALKQKAQQDSALQSQLTAAEASLDNTRRQIEALGLKITWLTPLADAGVLAKTLSEKNEELATQQILLTSYRQTYTELLVSGKIKGATDTIASLEKSAALYQQIYINLLSNRETVRLNRMQNVLNVVQVNPALATAAPIRPRTSSNTLMGGFGGLFLAVFAVLMMDFLDATIKTREDVERVLGLPVMGYSLVMESAEDDKAGPYVARVPRSPAAEAYRSLRTNLEFIAVDKPLRSILISSPGASEGKTTIAANLAAVMTQNGKRVLLLDADLRRPRVHQEMGMSNRVGLSDVFRDRLALKDVIQTGDSLNLSVLPSGAIPPNPAELLGSEKMRQILDELQSEFDLVIVDSTPTIVTDSQLIAARVDGVLLVLWPGRSNTEAARSAVEQYRHVGARMLGVVMNNIQPGQGYGYTPYGKGYYRYEHNETAGNGGKRGWIGRIKLPWRRAASKGKPEAAPNAEV